MALLKSANFLLFHLRMTSKEFSVNLVSRNMRWYALFYHLILGQVIQKTTAAVTVLLKLKMSLGGDIRNVPRLDDQNSNTLQSSLQM